MLDFGTCVVAVLLFYLALGKIDTERWHSGLATKSQRARRYTVAVRAPPKDADDPDEWAAFFGRFGPVVYVTVARDNRRLLMALVRRRWLRLLSDLAADEDSKATEWDATAAHHQPTSPAAAAAPGRAAAAATPLSPDGALEVLENEEAMLMPQVTVLKWWARRLGLAKLQATSLERAAADNAAKIAELADPDGGRYVEGSGGGAAAPARYRRYCCTASSCF